MIKRVLAVISMAATLAVSAMPVSAMDYDMNTPQYKVLTQALVSDFPHSELYLEFYNRSIDKDADCNDKGEPVIIAHHVLYLTNIFKEVRRRGKPLFMRPTRCGFQLSQQRL